MSIYIGIQYLSISMSISMSISISISRVLYLYASYLPPEVHLYLKTLENEDIAVVFGYQPLNDMHILDGGALKVWLLPSQSHN